MAAFTGTPGYIAQRVTYYGRKQTVKVLVALVMETKKTPSPRGRPRRFDRDAALNTAMEVFWKHGYEGTSLADLTAAMRINPPSLYAAFGSKELLFLEAVERYGETYGAYSERALQEAPTARAAIQQLLCDAAIAFTLPEVPYGCFVTSTATNCSPASAEVKEALRQRRIVRESAMRERIERGVAANELPPDTNTAALTKFYSSVLQGMSVQARDGDSKEELALVAETAMKAWPASESSLS